jgi:NADH dehydrogenase
LFPFSIRYLGFTVMAQRDAVTGAQGFTGRHIANRLLAQGRDVVNLTGHLDREDHFGGRVPAQRLAFDDPAALRQSLEGVDTLYNTYWIRFPGYGITHEDAVRNSTTLFTAAREAGVRRIVHISIANPDGSERSYYRGKLAVEQALAASGVSHGIVRPAGAQFGDQSRLFNTIAWLLRHSPVFGVPGCGQYPVQPVDVLDTARIAVELAARDDNLTVDAAGPETFAFRECVELIRVAIRSHALVVPAPATMALLAARAFGSVLHDVLLTRDEIEDLQAGLLVSHDPPLGRNRFSDWVRDSAEWLGKEYVPEVSWHYANAAR